LAAAVVGGAAVVAVVAEGATVVALPLRVVPGTVVPVTVVGVVPPSLPPRAEIMAGMLGGIGMVAVGDP
jgi:hypothetical protein